MPRFQATLTDADGQTQATFLQAQDADDAQRILEQRGHAATDLREVSEGNTPGSVAGHLMPCPACGQSVSRQAAACPHCGQALGPQGDATGGLIPYKNPCALVAYYLGLFSLFPLLGFFLAVPALILGVIGLRKRKLQPEIKGAAHAWIGIVMGGLFTLIWGAVFALIIIVLVMASQQP